MKKIFLLSFTLLLAVLNASATIAVCGIDPDDNGHFDCPFIKSGSITWDEASRTLTLDNAVVEHSSETPYDYVYPIRVTEDATIVIHGDCKLTTTGFVAMSLDGYNSKSITIQGDGNLYLNSELRGIFLVCTRLTIKDITLQAAKHIANNGDGVLVALTFDNVSADIQGGVARIGEGITFRNCSITYPSDAYIAHDASEDVDYGYYIAYGDNIFAEHIIISRGSGNIPGDVNGDGEVNIADVNAVIDVILGGSSTPRADVNSDGEINIADVNAVIDIIFGGGPAQNNHEYVDLGLPSGTLWATCNIGANSPEEYGDYFAWGETAPKEVYSWETYKWCDGTWDSLTKYNFQNYYGTVDKKAELDPADDAAQAKWGASWQMPTKAQQDELSEHCNWQWTTKNGVNGYLGTGPSGKTIFLPAAGYKDGTGIVTEGTFGYYWSHSLNNSMSLYAYNQLFFSGSSPSWNKQERSFGISIRPVRVP
ncbi:MAG: dockerin type I repeat-containing protein [Muribaculaceae bacterium]|nr:dockerin type I repeat-containing protein [Muribaculaceae bacterium]MBQ7205473.1 dockerin type I repeat-containing protein [Muribaculaceae bacterium]